MGRDLLAFDDVPRTVGMLTCRLGRVGFDALIEAGYTGRKPWPPADATIWNGHII